MVSDPIADLLTRIRNATMRSHDEVVVPTSKMLESIVKILKEEGYIGEYKIEKDDESVVDNIRIQLKYDENGKPVVSRLKRVSRPGLRKYVAYRNIKPVLNNIGIGIYSTPKGILTDKQAITERVGGEYLCMIW
ncbi:MAG: 30S ribosomal protein S8 [Candidatus Dojkabacteria bacterium]